MPTRCLQNRSTAKAALTKLVGASVPINNAIAVVAVAKSCSGPHVALANANPDATATLANLSQTAIAAFSK